MLTSDHQTYNTEIVFKSTVDILLPDTTCRALSVTESSSCVTLYPFPEQNALYYISLRTDVMRDGETCSLHVMFTSNGMYTFVLG